MCRTHRSAPLWDCLTSPPELLTIRGHNPLSSPQKTLGQLLSYLYNCHHFAILTNRIDCSHAQ